MHTHTHTHTHTEAEVHLFARLIKRGDTVVDAGAHIGTNSQMSVPRYIYLYMPVYVLIYARIYTYSVVHLVDTERFFFWVPMCAQGVSILQSVLCSQNNKCSTHTGANDI